MSVTALPGKITRIAQEEVHFVAHCSGFTLYDPAEEIRRSYFNKYIDDVFLGQTRSKCHTGPLHKE